MLYLDKKKAFELSRRISLYRNALTIKPGVITYSDNTTSRGVELLIDNTSLGTMSHLEVLSLLEQLEHFDITTFSLVAGLVDEMEAMNTRLDTMTSMLNTLLERTADSKPTPPPASDIGPVLKWENLDITPY